jgi:plasmid stabilization system protein ParE
MRPYLLTHAAEDDLFEIWTSIATDNLRAADELEADLLLACQKLSDCPGLGHFRRDLTDRPVRFFLVRHNYLVVYDAAAQPLQIIRILHGARDIGAELSR